MSLKGFEPPTHGLEGRCSIQLSYEHTTVMRIFHNKAGDGNRTQVSSLEGWCSTIELHPHIIGVTGFEPATSWSQTRRSSQAEPHPVFFCRITVVLPATQELLYGKTRILSTTFSNFFKKLFKCLQTLYFCGFAGISHIEFSKYFSKNFCKIRVSFSYSPLKNKLQI